LSPVTAYKFLVFSENGVSNMTNGGPEFIDITVTTEASATSASVNNVRVTSTKPTEVALAWDPPFMPDIEGDPSNFIESYEVSETLVDTAFRIF
jgi:ephrin-B